MFTSRAIPSASESGDRFSWLVAFPGLLASVSVTCTSLAPEPPVQFRSMLKVLGVVRPDELKSTTLTVPKSTLKFGRLTVQVGLNIVTVIGRANLKFKILRLSWFRTKALAAIWLGSIWPPVDISPVLKSAISRSVVSRIDVVVVGMMPSRGSFPEISKSFKNKPNAIPGMPLSYKFTPPLVPTMGYSESTRILTPSASHVTAISGDEPLNVINFKNFPWVLIRQLGPPSHLLGCLLSDQ